MPNKDPLLSFNEFCKEKDNLQVRFAVAPDGEPIIATSIYREGPAYKKCTQDFPKEFGRLARALARMINSSALGSQNYLKKLYRAYRMMYPYAESNKELFE